MSRYPHFITTKKEGGWPQIVLCVDCSVDLLRLGATGGREAEQLFSWHIAECLTYNGMWISGMRICGQPISGFWRTLASYANKYQNIWLVSYQCGRIWTLLDLWTQLEDGHVRIMERSESAGERLSSTVCRVQKDSADPLSALHASAVSRMLGSGGGLLVTEDPPCIVAFRMRDIGCRLTWVDGRNYGVEAFGAARPGSDRATKIAQWWIDYTQALREYKLGAPKHTAGAQGVQGWRQSYYTGGVHVHTNQLAIQLEGGSYHGGRCECFKIGPIRGTAYHLDIRSMYPSICEAIPLPARLAGYSSADCESIGRRVRQQWGIIARCEIETEEPSYPVRRDGVTIWPVGRFTALLAGPELYDAIDKGRVRQWYEVAWYEMEDCLRDIARSLYHWRCACEREGKQALAQSAKKVLVSLPGKFAQRARWWTACPDIPADLPWDTYWGVDDNGTPCRYRSIGGQTQRDTDMGWGGESVPSIASWITSAGRMRLLDAIRTAGWDSVYYCDTDSLILTEQGYGRLETSGFVERSTLGKWQLKEIVTDGRINGIKYYNSNGRVVCAGLHRGSCTDVGDGAHYWYSPSPSDCAWRGVRPEPTRELRHYGRTMDYRHGVVMEDGRVEPIRLEE